MYTFVTGGFRSGRSNYALRRAGELGPPPWLYVTPGEDDDASVKKRIERQRRDTEAIWRTEVMPDDLGTLLGPSVIGKWGAVVIDSFPAWLAMRLARAPKANDATVLSEVTELADQLYRAHVPLVVVSQEVGFSRPPFDPDGLRFVRELTSANQILAANASHVVLMVSGVPLRVR